MQKAHTGKGEAILLVWAAGYQRACRWGRAAGRLGGGAAQQDGTDHDQHRAAYKRALDQIVFRATLARSYLTAKRRFSRFGARPVIRGRVRCRVGGTAIVGDRFVAEGMIAAINLKVLPGAVLTMGHDVYLNGGGLHRGLPRHQDRQQRSHRAVRVGHRR